MAYIDKNDDRSLIIDLQVRLRDLSAWLDDEELAIPATGVFDSTTEAAVRRFQQTNGLSVTGEVDLETWETIGARHRDAEERYGRSRPLKPFPDRRGHTVRRGERSTLVFIVQIMLNELRLNYDSYGYLPLNGRFDVSTSNAVGEFQRQTGLEVTGEVDKPTWNRLADEYNLAVRDGNT